MWFGLDEGGFWIFLCARTLALRRGDGGGVGTPRDEGWENCLRKTLGRACLRANERALLGVKYMPNGGAISTRRRRTLASN